MSESLLPANPEQAPAALEIIRTETALSRYPVHRLASKGVVSINIRKQDEKGAVSLLWEVTYNSKHGQPGPLAYKLDTLVINRRIEEAGRPVPKVIKLGSLREVADELDLGGNTNLLKRALRQNAFAGISAKITYKAFDKTERYLEAEFTRYSIVFTGENLPSGQKADAVCLVLNDIYMEVLNSATRRPLDYDYLRELSPASQRFYEIVSYQMLPAIKYNQRAKLAYSQFCLFSTLTRYETFDQVKKQMYKIHQPLVRAGYIAKVEYEAVMDEEGRPDWNMFYIPGEAAKRQQLIFEFRGGVPAKRPERKFKSSKPKAMEVTINPAPQLPFSSQADPGDPRAAKLVRSFYRLRYGREQPPTERELREAEQHLATGEAWATFLVEFSARQGREQNGFPNEFGGVKKLEAQAQVPFEAERQKRETTILRKARQSHEEAHRGAYEAFLRELLGGRLESSLPEAYRAFTEQEENTFRFHRQRAAKPDASERAKEVARTFHDEGSRVRRLVEFIEKNPKCGIPSFWQWDEKMNSSPFKFRSVVT